MNNRNQWLKLDLSGNVYPTLQRKSFSSVFRVSVTLKEKVDPQILQKAYEKTLPRLKLDLSGNVYPTLQRKSFSSVFRVSVTLKEKVDPQILQKAYEKTLPRFPSLKVALRKGLFWRYLEPNKNPVPQVERDVKNPCMPMDFKTKHRYLIPLSDPSVLL